MPDLGSNSAWLGGDGEGWERGAYYVRGLVSLAYETGDEMLIAKARKWINWTLDNQRPDGQIGPKTNDDWWPRMVMNWTLRDYYEATGDPRVIPVLTRYAHYLQDNLPKRPVAQWAKARAGDQIDTLYWLYNRTGEPFLLDTADILRRQANDWNHFFADLHGTKGDFRPTHGVNVAQGIKFPLEAYQRTGSDADRAVYLEAWEILRSRHGLPAGLWSGTELLASQATSQGVEMCSIVEQMMSHETALAVLGEPVLGDQLEQIAFNLLPGGTTKDFHQFQYYTLVNQPVAHGGPKGVYGFRDDHGNDLVPGPMSGFPCCCFNIHMGWPKYVQHTWMASPDGGLAAVAYGPTEVTTMLGGTSVTITENTDYPFSDTLHFVVTPEKPIAFPLRLRIPAWAVAPQVKVNGEKVEGEVRPGSFLLIARSWKAGDIVEAEFPARLGVIGAIRGSATLCRGPLVFSLRIGEKATAMKGTAGFEELAMDPITPWNYGLDLDPAAFETSVHLVRGPVPENPWWPDTTPIKLTVAARRLPQWGLAQAGYLADEVPESPAESREPLETVTLVPFGAQTLRITAFPLLRRSTDPARNRQ